MRQTEAQGRPTVPHTSNSVTAIGIPFSFTVFSLGLEHLSARERVHTAPDASGQFSHKEQEADPFFFFFDRKRRDSAHESNADGTEEVR